MAKDKEKDKLSVVVVGHVDSGKSTLTGHLAYICGAIDKRTIDKFEKDATEMNRASFKFAWVLDKTNQERTRGITIDCTIIQLVTALKALTVIDAPGHRDFIKNMLSGTSQADAAVIVIPATKGEFEAAIGDTGCVRQQCKLTFTTGIRTVIVFVNKMDVIEYSEERYNEIRDYMLPMLKKIGFALPAIAVMPGSGLAGDNIKEPSPNMPWFTGWKYKHTHPDKTVEDIQGKTLYDWLNSLIEPPRDLLKDLRGTLNDCYKVGGVGVVAVGRVQAGIIKPGETIYVAPVDIVTEVKSVEMHHIALDKATPGDNIGINLKNVAAKDLRRGCVFGLVSKNPPREASMFTANIMAIEKIGADSGIRVNYCPVLDVHSAHLPVKVTKIISVSSKKQSKNALDEGLPLCIKKDDSGIVELTPQKPVSVECFSDYPSLGRFSMRDSNQTVAVGVVKSVTKKEPSAKSAAGAAGGAAKGKAGGAKTKK